MRLQTILVTDDDAVIRALVKITLSSDQYEIIEASDGNETLGLIKEHQPVLVFLDVSMPGISGFDVCKQVKNDPKLCRTKVVMLTAKAQDSDIERGKAVGADDYITKPFSPLNLLRKVDEILSGGGERFPTSESN